MAQEDSNVFRYVHSNELEIPMQIKVGTLEGSLPRLNYHDLLQDPILKFSGRNLSKFPDLKIELVVVDYPNDAAGDASTGPAVQDGDEDAEDGDWAGFCRFPRPGGVPLHSPIFTSYKHFTRRWEWNEWVRLPVKYSDLPRTAMLAITVYDCSGSGGIEDPLPNQMAVGGTTVSLFCKNGTLRQGPADLRVWAGVTADPNTLNEPDHRMDESGQADGGGGDSETLSRLTKLTKKYRAGKIPAVDWLDRLSFAEMEKISKREKSAMKLLFLDVQFTQFQSKGINFNLSFIYFLSSKSMFYPFKKKVSITLWFISNLEAIKSSPIHP